MVHLKMLFEVLESIRVLVLWLLWWNHSIKVIYFRIE